MVTIAGVLAVIALGLGVVNAGLNAKTIYNIETDRSYVAAASRALGQARVQANNRLQNAQASRDPIAIAQAEEQRDRLRLLERRVNVNAVSRQVEQTKESYREDQWRKFQVQVFIWTVDGLVLSRAEFGKVQDAYTRSRNWPPDPSKSFLTWDPQTKQAVRIVFDRDRPQLNGSFWEDDLKDALDIVLTGYDVMSTASQDNPPTAEEALAAVRQGLERMGNVQALPDVIGDYLVIALLRKVAAGNPQIQGLPEDEQAAFVCDQTRRQLQQMAADEADLDRSAIIRAAMDRLICLEPATTSATAPDSSKPPKPDSKPGVAVKPDPLPWTFKGKASSYTNSVTTRWGQASSATLVDTPDIQITLHPDGTAEEILSTTKRFTYYCTPADPARDGTVTVVDSPGTARLTGTHADGEFALNAKSPLRGSYSAESITGGYSSQSTGKVSGCGETTSSFEMSFTLDRVKSDR